MAIQEESEKIISQELFLNVIEKIGPHSKIEDAEEFLIRFKKFYCYWQLDGGHDRDFLRFQEYDTKKRVGSIWHDVKMLRLSIFEHQFCCELEERDEVRKRMNLEEICGIEIGEKEDALLDGTGLDGVFEEDDDYRIAVPRSKVSKGRLLGHLDMPWDKKMTFIFSCIRAVRLNVTETWKIAERDLRIFAAWQEASAERKGWLYWLKGKP